MTENAAKKFILAVPKGRILEELTPILKACDIVPEDDFFSKHSRKLQFSTNHKNLDIIRVRAFDVATFVAYGGAQMGIVGSDVIEEFSFEDLYSPVDLKIGHCRLSVAVPEDRAEDDPTKWSHVRIATKYPNLTARHFAKRGVQAECIKLNGAMEIAPALKLSNKIVDLVSTGKTLKENRLKELETILTVSSRFVVNRTSLKTEPQIIQGWVEKFRKSVA